MTAQKWVRSSLRTLSAKLEAAGHAVSVPTLARLLRKLDYSLHVNAKRIEASSNHPDREQQFDYIAVQRAVFTAAGLPILSVDTKKKLRHEVARSEWTRRKETGLNAGCVVSGMCSMAWPHPRRASLATAGCEALGESRRTPVPSKGSRARGRPDG
jgi:Rhodopirellula transposase DDE domain